MANKIQIRRGLKQDLPLLSIGEPALTTDSLEVYVGGGTQNIELAKKDYVDGQFTTIADQINDITTNGVSKLASYEYDLYATVNNQTVFEIPYELFETNTDTLMVFFDGMKRPKSDYVVTDPVDVGGVITKGYITLTEGRPINSYVGLEILKNVVNDATGVFSGSLIAENSTPQSKIIGLEEALNNIDTSIGNAVSFVSVQPGTSEPVIPFSEYDFKQHIMDLESDVATAKTNITTNTTGIASINTNVGDKATLTTTDKTSIVKAINENVTNIATNASNIALLKNPNLLINGDFQVWQRGSSITCNNGVHYTADRWLMWNGATNTTIANGSWNMSWTCGGNDNLIQIVEMPTRNLGRSLTLSCLIMLPVGKTISIHCAGATSGTVSDTGVVLVYTGTGVWETIKLAIPASVNNKSLFMVQFSCGWSGISIGLTNVKLELGTIATPFESRLYVEELALCQRYYEKSDVFNCGIGAYATEVSAMVNYKVTKRSASTLTIYDQSGNLNKVNIYGSGTNFSITSSVGDTKGILIIRCAGGGLTIGQSYVFTWIADSEIY